MNVKLVGKYLGLLMWAEGAAMLPSALVSVIYGGEEHALAALLASAGLCGLAGLGFFLLCHKAGGAVYAREGFVVAGVGWLLVSLGGALPFFLSGEIPGFADAFFESVAGFTTTGTFLQSNLEQWARGLLFWRNFTQWLGGIGVLALVLALVRGKNGGGAMNLFRAETPGPTVGKVMPKLRDSIQSIYLIYLGLSALNLLLLLLGRMPLYDALCVMFGTAGTGGFGVHSTGMADYSAYLQGVTAVFMALFGVSFGLYHLLLRGEWRAALRDEELRLYAGTILGAVGVITVTLAASGIFSFSKSLHSSAFMVSSVITSTGFSIGDYGHWPALSRAILFVLMIVGAMGGSTAGGFKMGRLLILAKSVRSGLYRLTHPRSVMRVRMNGKPLDEGVPARIQLFLSLYCGVVLAAFLLVSLDGLPLEQNLTAVIACFNNIGPGFGLVTSVSHFGDYSLFSKLVLSFCMLLGRLEIFPILLLLSPTTWRLKA